MAALSAGSKVTPGDVSPDVRRVRAELAATDWEEHAVVDVVTFAPATGRGLEGDRQRTELYLYRKEAPPPETYENGERPYRVERVTRPLYRRHAADT